MAQDNTPRVKTPPEESSVNVGRQAPAPGLQDDAGNPNPVDVEREPLNTVDRDDQPVADRAEGMKGLWDREDADPDETLETGDDVEVRHIPAEKHDG
ncbi:MAG: hypothetical protein JWN07_78 [Hyphomicrobiales bacterium]|nr:hypothetical protein [Hyphomicrobiales bacterium]